MSTLVKGSREIPVPFTLALLFPGAGAGLAFTNEFTIAFALAAFPDLSFNIDSNRQLTHSSSMYP